MEDIQCPYCEEFLNICHDDGYGYEEGEVFHQECDFCKKIFTYTTSTIHVYDVSKAPCLNGENHDWQDVQGYPLGWQSNRKRCSYCDIVELKDKSLKYDSKTDAWVK